MVTYLEDKLKRPDVQPKKREARVYQTSFKTEDIPLPGWVDLLKKEVTYPYPPQVVAIGMMFPVGIPANLNEDLTGKIVNRDGDKVWLKQARNIVVCTSTSSGKTYDIKLFLLKHLSTNGVAIYTCPFKALAEEKYDEFSKQFPTLRIGLATGDYHDTRTSVIENTDILVTSYEKLDSMLRNNRDAIEKAVRCIAIDEIHFLGTDRGPIIESLVMKLSMMKSIPMMATSATVGNATKIASWLHAELLVSDFRPVPLKLGVLIGSEIEYKDHTIEQFDVPKTDSAMHVIAKKVMDGHQVMYVRMTRRNAQSFASKLVSVLRGRFHDPSIEIPLKGRVQDHSDEELELNRCIKYGIAWHHAGLPPDIKAYIEEQFKAGKIRIIIATTTLGAGVNLPAEYVFMDWKRFSGTGSDPILTMEALQIVGRAGRPQYDEMGFGIFVCMKEEDVEYCESKYINGKPEPVKSALLKDESEMYHSIIGFIGAGYATTHADIRSMYKESFAYHVNPTETTRKVDDAIEAFKHFKEPMITVDAKGVYSLTPVGMIVKRYYINPPDADNIITMIKAMNDTTHLAIVHTIARCSNIQSLSIKSSDEYWDNIYIHVREKRMLFYPVNANNEREWKIFKTSCMLIGTEYPGNMGMTETIYADEDMDMQRLSYVHGIVTGDLMRTVGNGGNIFWLLAFSRAVARQYKKPVIEAKIAEVEQRLRYGISQKLVPICNIKNIGKERGKALFHAGYCDVETIADARPSDLSDLDVNGTKLGFKLATSIIESAKELNGNEKNETGKKNGKQSATLDAYLGR